MDLFQEVGGGPTPFLLAVADAHLARTGGTVRQVARISGKNGHVIGEKNVIFVY